MPCASGPWYLNDQLVFTVNMHLPTGEEADADAPPTYRVYEMETGTPLLVGTMAKLDDPNTVGLYAASIVLSAANGFEAGKSYALREHATVAGTTASHLDMFKVGIGGAEPGTPPDVEGVPYKDMMAAIMAALFGVAQVSGSTVLFKARDGMTTKVTVTVGGSGQRTVSILHPA